MKSWFLLWLSCSLIVLTSPGRMLLLLSIFVIIFCFYFAVIWECGLYYFNFLEFIKDFFVASYMIKFGISCFQDLEFNIRAARSNLGIQFLYLYIFFCLRISHELSEVSYAYISVNTVLETAAARLLSMSLAGASSSQSPSCHDEQPKANGNLRDPLLHVRLLPWFYLR